MAVPISSEEAQVWQHLKQAITDSSGFKRWQQERTLEYQESLNSLDSQVRRYLRETLKTLAY